MAIEHKNIPDAERHEPKGASTATVNQIARANGDGSTTFVTPSTLPLVTLTPVPQVVSTAAQGPTALDTPYQVVFGTGGGDHINVASNGVITFLTGGLFHGEVNLNVGRSNNTGVAIILARLLVNNNPSGIVHGVRIDASTDTRQIRFPIFGQFAQNDTLRVQIMRDSAGANDGGLVPIDPVVAGWNTVPSASVMIGKLLGGY